MHVTAVWASNGDLESVELTSDNPDCDSPSDDVQINQMGGPGTWAYNASDASGDQTVAAFMSWYTEDITNLLSAGVNSPGKTCAIGAMNLYLAP